MLPRRHIDDLYAKQQELEREIQHRALVNQVLVRLESPKTKAYGLLVRFGGWLIEQGERLEARYRSDEQPIMPIHQTMKAR